MIYIPTSAGAPPAVSIKEADDVETAQRVMGTLSSAPSVCYDLILFTLSVLFVPLVILFCVAL